MIIGIGEANLEEAETLLEPYLQKFPNVSTQYSLPKILNKRMAASLLSFLFLSRVPLFYSMLPEYLYCKEILKRYLLFVVFINVIVMDCAQY